MDQGKKIETEATTVAHNRVESTLQTMIVEDTGEGDLEPASKKSLAFKLAFIGLAASSFVFQVDATSLGVALPTIAKDLHGKSLESFWASISYTLCGLIVQPVWASISDAFGRKIPLFICIACFFIGSIVFALAENMKTIIIGRVLQGFGGGGIDVLVEIIVADITTLKDRSFYLGLMGAPNAIGNILGPSVGALFANYVSWRWIGWVNLPILGVAAPLLVFSLHLRPVETSPLDSFNRLDLIGMALMVTGITIFVLPLSWADSLFPWTAWQTLFPLFLGAALMIAFAIYEAKPAQPIVPYRLFHSKTGNMTFVGAFIHGMILISLLQYLPLTYQAIELETAIRSAVTLLPTSVVSVVFAVISMIMVSVIGGYVWIIRFSWLIIVLGTGILALFDVGSSSSMRFGLPILWGAGVAMLRILLLPIQASVKNIDDTGLAIAQLLTIRMFGGVIGLTVASTIFSSIYSSSISSIKLTGSLAPLTNAKNAVAFIPELRTLSISSELLDSILRVYLKSLRTIFYTMAGFGGLGLITSLFTEDLDLNKEDLGRQHFEE